MRRKDREITDQNAIKQIFQDAFVCHLAMVDDGKPYIVPLNFVYHDGAIIVHSAKNGRKVDILKKNPQVCFQLETTNPNIVRNGEQPCDWGTSYRSIIGYGTAEILDSNEDKIQALNAFVRRFDAGNHTFPASEVQATTVIRIKIDSLTAKAANT